MKVTVRSALHLTTSQLLNDFPLSLENNISVHSDAGFMIVRRGAKVVHHVIQPTLCSDQLMLGSGKEMKTSCVQSPRLTQIYDTIVYCVVTNTPRQGVIDSGHIYYSQYKLIDVL